MRGLLENSSDKDETKTCLVSYQYYEEKIILKNLKQNRGTVSLQHNRGTSKNNAKILKQNEGAVSLLHNRGVSKNYCKIMRQAEGSMSLLHNEGIKIPPPIFGLF